MLESRISHREVEKAVADPAIVLALCHFGGIGVEVWAGDVVMKRRSPLPDTAALVVTRPNRAQKGSAPSGHIGDTFPVQNGALWPNDRCRANDLRPFPGLAP
jgi:hypothetical protein